MKTLIALSLSLFALSGISQNINYTMPEETSEHEGTWLQWPHNHAYGQYYRDDSEPTWVEMTRNLVTGENVHIIAYDQSEVDHIKQLLQTENIPLTNVDFFIYQTDDFWVRDNGPIFAYDNDNNLVITDWGFNGWGNKTAYEKCDIIPISISNDINIPYVDVNDVVLEGGSIEIDGHGSMLATRSSITNTNRNPNLSEAEIEAKLTENLGLTNFIWLDGVPGLDITDFHIDGFARFLDENTIITMNDNDLAEWAVPAQDIATLHSATSISGNAYQIVALPLTTNNVTSAWGQDLGYKGSYINYYVGNSCVLVPTYNDPSDNGAIALIQTWYPNRTVVGIDVTNIYENGGMIHCITQQQPVQLSTGMRIKKEEQPTNRLTHFPNPATNDITIRFNADTETVFTINVFNKVGQLTSSKTGTTITGQNETVLLLKGLSPGTYFYSITTDEKVYETKKLVIN